MKIAIADDEALFRKGISRLLDDFGAELAFEAENGEALIKKLRASSQLPDLLLIDLNMPIVNGIDACKVIQKEFPDLKYIILSTYYSKAYILNMIELGAAAYLSKNATPEDMQTTIQQVLENGFYYDKNVMNVIRENMIKKNKPSFRTPFGISLTEREEEVLQLICEEYTTAEIAEQLFISKRTVDGHRNNLLQKLDCKNTAGLVIVAMQEQLVNISRLKFFK